jgi:hypothetical protein
MLWQSCPETSYISVSQHHSSQYGCHPETVEFISAYMTVKHLCPTQHWSCEDYLQWVATKTSYMHEIALKTVNSQTKLNMKKWMCSPVPVHHLHQKWSWLHNIIPLTSRTCFPYHKWQPYQHTSHKHEDKLHIILPYQGSSKPGIFGGMFGCGRLTFILSKGCMWAPGASSFPAHCLEKPWLQNRCNKKFRTMIHRTGSKEFHTKVFGVSLTECLKTLGSPYWSLNSLLNSPVPTKCRRGDNK